MAINFSNKGVVFVNPSQLGLEAGAVTTAEVYAAMPVATEAVLYESLVTDAPTSPCTIVLYKPQPNRGCAIAYGVRSPDNDQEWSMASQSTGVLSGTWEEKVAKYRAGDKITLGRCCVSGFVSGGGDTLIFTVPIFKPVNATSASFSGTVSVRGITGQYAVQGYALSTAKIYSISAAGITFQVDPVWTNAPTNNIAVSVDILDATITLS